MNASFLMIMSLLGSAISGALLEVLDSVKTTGIFSTHLHELLELPLTYSDRVSKRRMGVNWVKQTQASTMNHHNRKDEEQEGGGRRQEKAYLEPVWTYQIEDGVCVESLALHTGRKFGLPEPVLLRAAHLAQQFDTLCRSSSSSSSSTSPSSSLSDLPASSSSSAHGFDSKRDLEQVKQVMQQVYQDSGMSGNDPCIAHIPAHWEVPPSLQAGKSCLYVLEIPRVVRETTPSSRPPLQRNDSHHHKCGSRDDQRVGGSLYYIGETDSLKHRLMTHRRKHKITNGGRDGASSSSKNMNRLQSMNSENEVLLWKELQVLVCPMPDKSTAREMETCLIKALAQHGFPLLSNYDANHQHFGK